MKSTLFNLTNRRIILVAQTHLSGVKQNWWQVYREFFDAGIVQWKTLDEFTATPVLLPYSQIPVNREVKYTTPIPRVPLEQEPDLPV
jgi:hypothetical protein